MQIRRLRVRNFKGFAEREFPFSSQFNVIVGDNGSGKSALLDALAVAAGSFFLGFDEIASRPIHRDEIRQVRFAATALAHAEYQVPVVIEAEGTLWLSGTDTGGAPRQLDLEWMRTLDRSDGRTTSRGADVIKEFSSRAQAAMREGAHQILPVIAYYGTGRVWRQRRERAVEPVKPGSRARGYVDALDPVANQKALVRWWKTAEMAAIQRREQIPGLDAVKQAVAQCLPQTESVFYDIAEDEVVRVSVPDRMVLPFRLLSDGYRNMLAMVADIAYRAAVLNPHLGNRALIETPGIILIDEIDLHLHPTWQRRVVDDLRKTFPRMQFMATTHSTFIVQSLRSGELINLDPDKPRAEYAGASIEDIAEAVMGVDQPARSKESIEKEQSAEEHFTLLRKLPQLSEQEQQEARVRLKELALRFADDPTYRAMLRVETLAHAESKE